MTEVGCGDRVGMGKGIFNAKSPSREDFWLEFAIPTLIFSFLCIFATLRQELFRRSAKSSDLLSSILYSPVLFPPMVKYGSDRVFWARCGANYPAIR